MAGLTFTVVGDAFFASADNGASTSTATITLRSDRKAAFLLTKCLRHCPDDSLLPDGLLGPPPPQTPNTTTAPPESHGTDVSDPTSNALADEKWISVDLSWTVADVARVHGHILQLCGTSHHSDTATSTDTTLVVESTLGVAGEGFATQQQSEAWLDAQMPARTECWQCDAASCHEMVARQRAAGAFLSPKVGRALLAADRREFCRFPDLAYADAPQTMGPGWSISAPHLHANALQVLAPLLRPGANCLDVGCGSGLITCAMTWLANGESFQLQGPGKEGSIVDSGSSRDGSHHSVSVEIGNGDDDDGNTTSSSNEAPLEQPLLLPWRCLGVDCVPAAITFATRVAHELCPDILHVNTHALRPIEGAHGLLHGTHFSAVPEGEEKEEKAHSNSPQVAIAPNAGPKSAPPTRPPPPSAAAETAEEAVNSAAETTIAAETATTRRADLNGRRPHGLEFTVADGWKSALYEEDSFDVIHVGAAADEVPPTLLRALAPGGRMVIAVQGALFCIDRASSLHAPLHPRSGGGIDGGEPLLDSVCSNAGAPASPIRAGLRYEELLKLPLGYTATVVYEEAGFTPLHRGIT